MYSKESIKKVVKLMDEKIAFYRGIKNPDEIKICISKGNRKIGKVLNVSLPPMITCANCSGCMWFCYDVKACLQYPNTVIDARVRNYILMKEYRDEYFNRIRMTISRRKKNKFFRWHVSGDIPDENYLENMVEIAKDFPEFKFWTYTKNYNLVNEYVKNHGNDRKIAIPENLVIMYSEWKGMKMINPFGFPEFRCLFPNEKPEEGFTACPGNCDICISTKGGCPYGKNKYVDLH